MSNDIQNIRTLDISGSVREQVKKSQGIVDGGKLTPPREAFHVGAILGAMGGLMVVAPGVASVASDTGIRAIPGAFIFMGTLAVTILLSGLAFVVLNHLINASALKERRAKYSPEQLEWHERYVAHVARAERFNERLGALQQFARHAGPDREVEYPLTDTYVQERDALEKEFDALMRQDALWKLEAAVLRGDDGRFRDTRDVTEAVFVQRVRLDDADREIEELTAGASPNVAPPVRQG